MEQLEDMHEFEKNAKRKAYFIKEGKRRIITKKTTYLIRGMSFQTVDKLDVNSLFF